MRKVTLIVPCYNEEAGIPKVIDGIPHSALRRNGYRLEVIVIDNNSKDRTASVARRNGARVIRERRQGKGYAVRAALAAVPDDSDYVVMIDGDNTYKTAEILRLLEPLRSGFADVVVGSRLMGRMQRGSMSAFNRLGNWFFTFLVRVFVQGNVSDTLSGYYAWRRDVVAQLRRHLRSPDFRIEMEMIVKMTRLGYFLVSVPITYDTRAGRTHLRPIRDGIKILATFLRYQTWRP